MRPDADELSVAQAAAVLNVSAPYVLQLVRAQVLPCRLRDGAPVLPSQAVRALAEAQRTDRGQLLAELAGDYGADAF